jgi:putative ATPase
LGAELYLFNAVLAGVPELKKLIARALETKKFHQDKSIIIFIDEIHRFNKAQQDALLPYVENGSFILFGATTENPRSALNRALLSRVQIVELKPLSVTALKTILMRAKSIESAHLQEEIINFLAQHAGGDARKAMSWLESILRQQLTNIDDVKNWVLENSRAYDKTEDRHYDVISAFIKSMRGSDPSAALLWLAVMLDGGEDPVFVARRMVIFASEDVGNADPQALLLATAALQAVSSIGMPEARINLAQVVCYLAGTVKSNAAYEGINEALTYVQENPTLEVPAHLKNFPPQGTPPYQYPHANLNAFVLQQYAPGNTPKFYRPKSIGREMAIKERLEQLWGKNQSQR